MNTVSNPPRGRTLIESALAHDRLLIAAVISVTLACWAWIVLLARDMYGTMRGASAWMMTTEWDAPHTVLLFAMWAVMMVGMMLPSASPVLLLYAGAARRRSDAVHPSTRVYAVAAGYLAVWIAFSAAATVMQRALSEWLLLSPMMTAASARVSGVLLLIAGLYQVTPLKRVCLDACRSPLAFIMAHWRGGSGGAFRMGVAHGMYCLGCCWAMMLLLFAGGVMNLYVIAAISAVVLLEKIAPLHAGYRLVSGLALVGVAAWIVFR